MEVLAHLAARLGVAMAANVVGLGPDDGGPLRVTRQVLGGAVLEEMAPAPGARPSFTVAGHAVAAEPGPVVTATVREFTAGRRGRGPGRAGRVDRGRRGAGPVGRG